MRQANDMITIKVSRFGSEPQEVSVPKDSTIRECLEEAGMSTGSNEKVYVNGERANLRDIIDEGDWLQVVTPKEAGSDVTTA